MNRIIEYILRVAKELTDEENNCRRKKVDSVRIPNIENEYVKHGRIVELKTAGAECMDDKKIARELLIIAGKLTPGEPDGTGPASGGDPQSGFGKGWCEDDDFDEEEEEYV